MKQVAALVCAFLVAAAADAADVTDLVKQLRSRDEEQRRTAAKSLGEMGTDAKPAVPALAAALKDDDLFVRRFAAQALGEIGIEAKSAVPALKTALGDAKKEVAAAAAGSLARLGPDGVKVLSDVLKNDKLDVAQRRQAVLGLGKAGADVKPVLPQLADALQNRDLRTDAVAAVGELGPNAKDDKIIKGLQDILGDNRTPREFRPVVQAALRRVQGKAK
jgi:HEAT repeat protein